MYHNYVIWFEYFIGSLICCLGLFFSGSIISYQKIRDIKFYHYLLIIFCSILMIFNSFIFNNVAKIFGMLLILYFLFKIVYKQSNKYILIVSIFTYIICILSEVSFSIITVFIDLVLNLDLILDTISSIVGNLIIAVFSCIYAYILKIKLNLLIKKLNENTFFYIFLLSIITILVVFSSMYNLYLNEWKINYEFVLNVIIIFGGLYLLFILIKQNIKNKEITSKYDGLKEYMKTSADLIERYSSAIHKYKNNLITIKGYLKTNVQGADEYIDQLLDNYKTKKYNWFSKINYIKVENLKYLVYYKLTKAEENNLKIFVSVSNDVKKISDDILNLHQVNIILEIIGEYFDNAIYASNESKEKELNFNMYLENKNLVLEIANTYKNKFDLNLITKNGYTTKGNNHGLGLYDVDKTIKKEIFLQNEYLKIDDYFIAKLIININNQK